MTLASQRLLPPPLRGGTQGTSWRSVDGAAGLGASRPPSDSFVEERRASAFARAHRSDAGASEHFAGYGASTAQSGAHDEDENPREQVPGFGAAAGAESGEHYEDKNALGQMAGFEEALAPSGKCIYPLLVSDREMHLPPLVSER